MFAKGILDDSGFALARGRVRAGLRDKSRCLADTRSRSAGRGHRRSDASNCSSPAVATARTAPPRTPLPTRGPASSGPCGARFRRRSRPPPASRSRRPRWLGRRKSSRRTSSHAPSKPALKKSPSQAARRPAAFAVPGAPKEPLDEISLPARARLLDAWLTSSRGPTAANERHWLYQHAWIVTGARFGWWHGAAALRVLIGRRPAGRVPVGRRPPE